MHNRQLTIYHIMQLVNVSMYWASDDTIPHRWMDMGTAPYTVHCTAGEYRDIHMYCYTQLNNIKQNNKSTQ